MTSNVTVMRKIEKKNYSKKQHGFTERHLQCKDDGMWDEVHSPAAACCWRCGV